MKGYKEISTAKIIGSPSPFSNNSSNGSYKKHYTSIGNTTNSRKS
jgi:hypothetical protein